FPNSIKLQSGKFFTLQYPNPWDLVYLIFLFLFFLFLLFKMILDLSVDNTTSNIAILEWMTCQFNRIYSNYEAICWSFCRIDITLILTVLGKSLYFIFKFNIFNTCNVSHTQRSKS